MAYSVKRIVAETKDSHVNNVKLFDYLDQARNEWYVYANALGIEAVVVNVNVSYQKEVFKQDALVIQTRLIQVGNTSFTIKQTITCHQEVVVMAKVVLTAINPNTRTKVTVPAEIRQLLDADIVFAP